MTHLVLCKDCNREIGYVANKKDVIMFSCCDKVDSFPARKKTQLYDPKEKEAYILDKIKQYRDYLVSEIYDRVKSKIGCYRTFNRCLDRLVKQGKLKRYRFINGKHVLIRRSTEVDKND